MTPDKAIKILQMEEKVRVLLGLTFEALEMPPNPNFVLFQDQVADLMKIAPEARKYLQDLDKAKSQRMTE